MISRLPRAIAIPALAYRSRERSDTTGRSSWQLDSHIRVDAYWLRFSGSAGPAISVFFDAEELLRVDCLAAEPHLHYCLAESRVRIGRGRVEISPGTPLALVQRACFELERNTAVALHLHRKRSVQRHSIDPIELAAVTASVRQHLEMLVEREAD